MSMRGTDNTVTYWPKRISLLALGLMLTLAAHPTSAASDAELAVAKEARAARAAAKASNGSVKKLERQLQKTQEAETAAKAAVATARSEANAAAAEEKAASGFAGVFGADPQKKLTRAEAKQADLANRASSLSSDLTAARLADTQARGRLASAESAHSEIVGARQRAADAEKAEAAKAKGTRKAYETALADHDRKQTEAVRLSADADQLTSRIAALEALEGGARQQVTGATTAATAAAESEDRAARRASIKALRKAERDFLAIAKELTAKRKKVGKVTAIAERAQQSAAGAASVLAAAETAYSPYEAADRAATEEAAAIKAQQRQEREDLAAARKQVKAEQDRIARQKRDVARAQAAEARQQAKEAKAEARQQAEKAKAETRQQAEKAEAEARQQAEKAKAEADRLAHAKKDKARAAADAKKAEAAKAKAIRKAYETAVADDNRTKKEAIRLSAAADQLASRVAELEGLEGGAKQQVAETSAAAAAAAESEDKSARRASIKALRKAERDFVGLSKDISAKRTKAGKARAAAEQAQQDSAAAAAALAEAAGAYSPYQAAETAAAEAAAAIKTQQEQERAAHKQEKAERDRVARQKHDEARAQAAEERRQAKAAKAEADGLARAERDKARAAADVVKRQAAEERRQAKEAKAEAKAEADGLARAERDKARAAADVVRAADDEAKRQAAEERRQAKEAKAAADGLARAERDVARAAADKAKRQAAAEKAEADRLARAERDKVRAEANREGDTERALKTASRAASGAEKDLADAIADQNEAKGDVAQAQTAAEAAKAEVAAHATLVDQAEDDDKARAKAMKALQKADKKSLRANADLEEARAAAAAAEQDAAAATAANDAAKSALATATADFQPFAAARAEEARLNEEVRVARQKVKEDMRIKKAQEKADRVAAREEASSDAEKLRREADATAAQAKEGEKAAERERKAAETRAQETADAEHQEAIADLQARRESFNRARAQRKAAEAELADIENAHRARIARLENELKFAKGEEAVAKIDIENNDQLTHLIPAQIRDAEGDLSKEKDALAEHASAIANATSDTAREEEILIMRGAGIRIDKLQEKMKSLRELLGNAGSDKLDAEKRLVLAVAQIREATARLATIDDERDGRYIDLRKKVDERRAVEDSMEEGLALLEENMLSTGYARREIHPKPKRGEGIVIYDGPYPAEGPPAAATARSADGPGGAQYDIGLVQVTGDREPVQQLENWEQYVNDAMYSPMSEQDIEAFRQTVLKDLQDDGYVFATVSVYKPSLKLGFLKLRVHVGDTGDITISGAKYHTADNLLKSSAWITGEKFNYRKLYGDLFNLNVRPDLQIDTRLKPKVDAFGRRVIDIELAVEDSYPMHLALSIANSGTEETGDWRARGTLQHLNLTDRNDTLTIEYMTDPGGFDNVSSLSMSYYTPIGADKGLTFYTGWSESDFDDIFPLLDIYGEGYYLGLQLSKVLKSTKNYSLDLTGGWIYRYTENTSDVAGVTSDRRDIKLSMPSAALGYSAKNFDRFGGRNFGSFTLTGNFAGKFGSASTAQFENQNKDATGEFWIGTLRMARLQKLFRGEQDPGKWTMFMEFEGQAADDSLVSAVQYRLGGAESVRGYEEAEVLGDSGIRGTLEVRTPLIDNFIPGLKHAEDFLAENPDHWSTHRLQFDAFADFGRVETSAQQPGEHSSQTMMSIGAGLRLGFTKYSQIRLDYGYPLEDTEETNEGEGQFHFKLEILK